MTGRCASCGWERPRSQLLVVWDRQGVWWYVCRPTVIAAHCFAAGVGSRHQHGIALADQQAHLRTTPNEIGGYR
jgi:hypothetical protein